VKVPAVPCQNSESRTKLTSPVTPRTRGWSNKGTTSGDSKLKTAGLPPLAVRIWVGAAYVAVRLAAFRESGVTTLNVTPLATAYEAQARLIEQVRAFAD
jgi:hypothetical protein